MQLYFIRHAQSTNNLLWERTGYDDGRHEDPELTEMGKRQAERVAQFLAQPSALKPTTRDAEALNIDGFNLTHLYASLMVRAMDTAAAIASATGLTPVARTDLHETGGIWLKHPVTEERNGLPGKTRAELAARHPQFELPDRLNSDGWWNQPMEAWEEGFSRAAALLDDLRTTHGEDDRVALVSHGMFYNQLMKVLLNLPREMDVWFVMNNVAITRIDFTERGVRLSYLNRVDFLPPEMVT